MSEVVLIRVPSNLIERVREKFPELDNESDSTVVRAALKKFLLEGDDNNA